jgi:hypothetical protein
MDTGVAVWLVDCWPNVIVHAHFGLVTVGRLEVFYKDNRAFCTYNT